METSKPAWAILRAAVIPAKTSTNDQGLLIHLDHLGGKGFKKGGLGNGHPHQVLGLFRGLSGLMHVDPGTLIPDIGHLEEITVEAGLPDRVLEERLMGSRSARGNNDPIQFVFFDDLLKQLLGILRAGVEIVIGIDDMGECPGILYDGRDIDHAGDIDSAVTDEGANPGSFIIHILFRDVFLFGHQGSSRRSEERGGFSCGSRGLGHGLGDILGAGKGATHENPRLRGLERGERSMSGQTRRG